jgi:hypothetical protein
MATGRQAARISGARRPALDLRLRARLPGGLFQARWLAGALALATVAEGACQSNAGLRPGAGGQGGVATATSTSAVSSSAAPSTAFASSSIAVGSGGGQGGGGGTDCVPDTLPPGVPSGWVHYKAWSCGCRFYVPGSAAALPAPMTWQPCPNAPGSTTCGAMVVDWTKSLVSIGINPFFDRNPDGSAVIQFRRIALDAVNPNPTTVDLVADADGAAHSALLNLWTGESVSQAGCYVINQGLQGGKQLLFAAGKHALMPQTPSLGRDIGAIGGSIDDLYPPVFEHEVVTTQALPGWAVGASWIAEEDASSTVTAYPWNLSKPQFVTSPATDPEGFSAFEFALYGNAFFWTTGTLFESGINSWNPVDGARPFIRWVGDLTQGAADLGTDGTDLVWSYGQGQQPGSTLYPTRSVMTASFTTDPKALAPRRLRSQPEPNFGVYPWVVGCGYAANLDPTGNAAANNATLVVRLSDGVSWTIPAVPGHFWTYQALGLTCDEVFIIAQVEGQETFARIRLDSLGAGMPPD